MVNRQEEAHQIRLPCHEPPLLHTISLGYKFQRRLIEVKYLLKRTVNSASPSKCTYTLHCCPLCCVVLCCAVLCCAVLCSVVQCCVGLCCVLLCCAVLCWDSVPQIDTCLIEWPHLISHPINVCASIQSAHPQQETGRLNTTLQICLFFYIITIPCIVPHSLPIQKHHHMMHACTLPAALSPV